MSQLRIATHNVLAELERFYPGGHQELLDIAQHCAEAGAHDGTFASSREDTTNGPLYLPVAIVPPVVLADRAPRIIDWYHGPLLEKARDFMGPLVVASEDPRNFPLINIHRGWNKILQAGEGYEAHVDTNRPTGLLYLGKKDRTPETGGALVVSNRGDVATRAEILKDCTRFYPKVGQLAIMDGYYISHFVEESVDGEDRIMLVCNFWTPDAPESNRPVGLAEYDAGRGVSRLKTV